MKRALPLLSLLLVPGWALAQPEAPAPAQPATPATAAPAAAPQQAPNPAALFAAMPFVFNDDNAAAVAQMGAFYNSVQKATSFKSHWTMTQTTVKDGITTKKQTLDMDAIWRKDEKDGLKSRYNIINTLVEDGKTTVDKFIKINNGAKSLRYYSDRNVWMAEEQTDDTAYDYAHLGAQLPWSVTMLRIPANSNLTTKQQDDGTSVVTSEDGAYEAVFNADGTLKDWKMGRATGQTVTIHFDTLTLNGPVPTDAFDWHIPPEAQKVPAEIPKENFTFNFDF